jgi:hypothetical protein
MLQQLAIDTLINFDVDTSCLEGTILESIHQLPRITTQYKQKEYPANQIF